jgi:hypothetical protein
MKLEEVNLKTKEAVNYLVQSLEAWTEFSAHAVSRSDGQVSHYSFGNIMLIARQKPDATHVAGYRTWTSLGRFVRRGEKGIFILAPMVGNKRNKDENAEQNTDSKETQRTLYGFRGVYVFDRLSRDLAPRLCALNVIREAHFRSPLDSSKYIITQVLCLVQRSLMEGAQLSASFVDPAPVEPSFKCISSTDTGRQQRRRLGRRSRLGYMHIRSWRLKVAQRARRQNHSQ